MKRSKNVIGSNLSRFIFNILYRSARATFDCAGAKIFFVFSVFDDHAGRFPFDQIFRFEIPGILCDEWNSIFQFVGLTNPRSSGSKFRAKIRDQTVCSFTFVYLLWGCSTTLKLK